MFGISELLFAETRMLQVQGVLGLEISPARIKTECLLSKNRILTGKIYYF